MDVSWGRARRLRVLCCLLVALVTSVGCTSTVIGTARPAGEGGKDQGEPAAQGRDKDAVAAALRDIDACKLLNVDEAKKRDVPEATTFPLGPHSCRLTSDSDPSSRRIMRVEVGAESTQLRRWRQKPVNIAGAKVYQYASSVTEGRSNCRMVIPVSFERAVTLDYDRRRSDGKACDVLRPFAEFAVQKLQEPASVAVDHAARPLSKWDGCTLLATVFGDKAGQYSYLPEGTYDPFSGCETTKRTGRTPESGPSVEVGYDEWPPSAWHEKTRIRGKNADVNELGSRCNVSWNQGDSKVDAKYLSATVVEMKAGDCQQATRLAEKAIETLKSEPANASAKPQRPLLYKPDERDTAGRGACVHFGATGGQADCEPYREVSLPDSARDIMAAAAENRHVQCAVFGDAVEQHFTEDLTPITWGAHCFFVEPAHEVQLRVNVDPVNRPGDYGQDERLWVERKETRYAGLPAVTFFDDDRKTYDIYVSPNGDLNQRGNLHLQLESLQGRGVDRDPPKLSEAQVKRADTVTKQVLRAHFT